MVNNYEFVHFLIKHYMFNSLKDSEVTFITFKSLTDKCQCLLMPKGNPDERELRVIYWLSGPKGDIVVKSTERKRNP